ncbi:MAG: universal stress protein [Thaumarchaeota archaeon]|nr:universal stress protein [Nitrososphaerota archaeon]
MKSEVKFSKILAAIDGSRQSIEAAHHALSLAKKDNAKLFILTVIFAPEYVFTVDTKKEFGGFLTKSKKEAEKWSAGIIREASEMGVETNTKATGEAYSVAGAIINYAEKIGADLIVLGSTGTSGFKKLLLGSVSEDVVRYAHCPVLVVR